MIARYQKYFIRSDAGGIIALNRQSAGQRLIDIQPVIMQEYLPLVMQRMMDRGMTLTDEMQKELTEAIKPNASSADKPTRR